MASQQFQVVFLGVEDEGYAVENVREAMARQFHLKPQLVDHLFAGRPVVVKRRLDAETAMRYKYLIDSLGGNARIEPMPPAFNMPGQPGFVERRKYDRRVLADRRKSARPLSFQNDRRQGCGRRATDYA
ncbi:MAG: hypothetical protein Kow006_04090 [Gammaproteobacteria bacterium]